MKIKGLLLGMFACAALVACTNDDIVENNNIEQPEKVKANLTLSISTSTGSGRAADAETGDDVENGTPSEGPSRKHCYKYPVKSVIHLLY